MGAVTAAVVGGGLAAAGAVTAAKMSSDAQKSGQNKAAGDQAAAMQYLNILTPPTATDMKVFYDHLTQVGTLTPEQEVAKQQNDTELAKIQTDPAYKTAQMDALKKLEEIGAAGGLTIQDKAKMEEIKTELANQNGAQQGAIMQNFAARGESGSGNELASRLSAGQSNSTIAAQQGFQVGADANKRALDAIAQSGQLGTQLQTNEFGQKAQVANAQDVINKYNTAQQSDVQQRNVDRSNIAQQANLNEAQHIADTNVAIGNAQKDKNASTVQQAYNNEVDLAKAKAGQQNVNANTAMAAGQNSANTIGGIGAGVTQVGTSLANYGLGQLAKTKAPTPTPTEV